MRSKEFAGVGTLYAPDENVYTKDFAWFKFSPATAGAHTYGVKVVNGNNTTIASATAVASSVEVECSAALANTSYYTVQGLVDGTVVATWGSVYINSMFGKTFVNRTHYAESVIFGGEQLSMVAPFRLTNVTYPGGATAEKVKGQTFPIDECCEGEIKMESYGEEAEYDWLGGMFFGVYASMVLPEEGGSLPNAFSAASVIDYFLQPLNNCSRPYLWQVCDGSTFEPIGGVCVVCDVMALQAGAITVVEVDFVGVTPNDVHSKSYGYLMNGAFANTTTDPQRWATSIRFASDGCPFEMYVDGVEDVTSNRYITLCKDGLYVTLNYSINLTVAKVNNIHHVASFLTTTSPSMTGYSTFGGVAQTNVVTRLCGGETSMEIPATYTICPNVYNSGGIATVDGVFAGSSIGMHLQGWGANFQYNNVYYTYRTKSSDGDKLPHVEVLSGTHTLVYPDTATIPAGVLALSVSMASNTVTFGYDFAEKSTSGVYTKATQGTSATLQFLDSSDNPLPTTPSLTGSTATVYNLLANHSGDITVTESGESVTVTAPDCPEGTEAEVMAIGEWGGVDTAEHTWTIIKPTAEVCGRMATIFYNNADGCGRYMYGIIESETTTVAASYLNQNNTPYGRSYGCQKVFKVLVKDARREMYLEDVLLNDTIRINDVSAVVTTLEVTADYGEYYDIELEILTDL